DRLAAFLVAVGGHKAGGLVIAPEPWPFDRRDLLAVHRDFIARPDIDSGALQRCPVHADAPSFDPAFRLTAGAEAGPGEPLGDPFCGFLVARHFGPSFAARIKASRISRSPSEIMYSGCHCTPRQKR